MSSDQEKAAIGGMVVEYGEVKRRIVALEQELKRVQSQMSSVEATLRHPPHTFQQDTFKNLLKNIDALPSREDLKAMIEEIRERGQRRNELQKALKECGVEM